MRGWRVDQHWRGKKLCAWDRKDISSRANIIREMNNDKNKDHVSKEQDQAS